MLPRKPDPPDPRNGHLVVELQDERADELLDALGTETTRRVLEAVCDDPRVASEIADALDISIQNTKYHLEKLQDAKLIDVTETWYSEQGNEMKVYGPTYSAFVVLAGEQDTLQKLRRYLLPGITVAGGVLLTGSVVSRLVDVTNVRYTSETGVSRLEGLFVEFLGPLLSSPALVFVFGAIIGVSLLLVSTAITDDRWTSRE